MAEMMLHTPLVAVTELPYRGRDIEIGESAGQGHVNLRSDDSPDGLSDALYEVCGVRLPRDANTTSGAQPPCALWLGPDEWLLRLPTEAEAAGVVRELDARLTGTLYAVNDLSSAQTVLRLSGERTRRVLSRGCTLDLHPRVFGVGQCAQTIVAQAQALLMPVDEAGSIELIVRRSFADYLARWLIDASI